jgi:hypothetical protein
MTWIGRKKLGFIPVHRPNAHPPDDPVPTDWSDEILRRVLFDPNATTGADLSLRAYIRAASSGLADLDAVVLPMVTIDQQDVPPDILEGQLGSQLREQGFDAAAIVMLGGIGAGTTRGFWCRFVMREGVGVWAMEFMHSLTGFADLYTLQGYSDYPFGDMGAFDEMACSCGTHPSAYTKAAVGWINPATIARHIARTVDYDLHSLSLVQPPPSGRWAAVGIGSQVPYLMVEARQRVDQFDGNIPTEGVIIYRIQTSDPLGRSQQNLIPVFLLTTAALTPGTSFTADGGVHVQVMRGLSGGFSVRIEDPNPHVVDWTGQFGIPAAAGPPTVCVIPGLSVHDIAYRDWTGNFPDMPGDLHELRRNAGGATETADLTEKAVGGAPRAIGNPFFYVDPTRNLPILLYRDGNGTVRSLYRFPDGTVGHDNLSGTAGAPSAAGDPVGYYMPPDNTHHVIYRTSDGNLHELNSLGVTPIKDGGNLTKDAPKAAGDPTAFANAAGLNFVVYRSKDNGEILSLYKSEGLSGLDRLSVVAGTPPAAGDPFGYYTAHDDTIQIVYLANDGHIYELYSTRNETIRGWDITPSDGAIGSSNFSAYYSAGTNTKHVFYRSADGHLHEIWWVPGGGTPAHVNLTLRFGAPLAADRPAAFTVEGPNTQHVAYRGTDYHIYEVIW